MVIRPGPYCLTGGFNQGLTQPPGGTPEARLHKLTMLSLIALIAWIAGVIVSFINGNRKMPIVVLLIGIGLIAAPIGVWKTVGLALLAAIIWIANKADNL